MSARTDPSFFSSAGSFAPEVGSRIGGSGRLRGYYIDFDFKAEAPSWPPPWLPPRDQQLHVSTAQWALGAWERYVKGEGEVWLRAALGAGDHLVAEQEQGDGPLAGAWTQRSAMPNTFDLEPPWVSSIAQGEAASLLARLHQETGEERYAEAARRALLPFWVPSGRGGVLAELEGGPFYEEYPTSPPSFVLNGGIFALWGAYDVGFGLDDASARELFEAGVETLARNIGSWDTGFWSLYCLHTRPMRNVASAAYHLLHITQLRAMKQVADRPEFAAAADRFEAYMSARLNRMRAFTSKGAFRLIVPRNRALAERLPRTS